MWNKRKMEGEEEKEGGKEERDGGEKEGRREEKQQQGGIWNSTTQLRAEDKSWGLERIDSCPESAPSLASLPHCN